MRPILRHEAPMPPDDARPAGAPIAGDLPYRPLWPVARAMIDTVPGVAFLDAGGATDAARWSILGWQPRRSLVWPQGKPGAMDGLRAALQSTASSRQQTTELPIHAGWAGWFSYDLGRHLERLPSRAAADPSVPDFAIAHYDLLLIEDRRDERLYFASTEQADVTEADLRRRVDEVLAAAHQESASPRRAPAASPPPRPGITRPEYERAVETILEHIRAGDIYQANLSHRFSTTSTKPAAEVYERLRAASPAPFGCFLGLERSPEVLSVSPELFLRTRGRRVETRPIKGTRPRGADAATDAGLLEQLRDSPKERAELLMITDLLRNDLGRVARYGSVRVPELRTLESHPTVHHAHSVVEAELAESVDATALIAATMPGGSVTGAPKIRAMEILDRLEPTRRGPYTGAAGFIADHGDLCLNILIRTIVRQGGEYWYRVGGGIVADSSPAEEYEETLAKAAALQEALSGA